MPIAVEYAPQANTVGPVAFTAGQGLYQQKQEARKDRFDLTKMQAQLQAEQMKAGFAMDLAKLNAGLQAQQQNQMMDMARMNFAANLQAQQQQFAQAMQVQEHQDNLAFRQAAGAQEFLLKGAMGFMELDQAERLAVLRNSTAATQAFQQLEARRNAITQARTDGYIDDIQQDQLMEAFARDAAGFSPQNFPLDGPFPPNQGMGDIWDETREIPGLGPTTLKYTRDRSGMPVLTQDSELMLKGAIDLHNQQKLMEYQDVNDIGIGRATARSGIKVPGGVPKMNEFNDMLTAIRDELISAGTTQTVDATGKKKTNIPNISDEQVMQAYAQRQRMYQQLYGHFFDADGVPAVRDLGEGVPNAMQQQPQITPDMLKQSVGMLRGTQQIPQPQSAAEYAMLPPGTQYIAGDGTIRVKQ